MMGATGAATGGFGVEIGATVEPDTPIEANRAPTATVESTATSMLKTVPETGDGISVSTLSVDTSSSASSALIESPTFFSQRVTVPSVTDSPSAGIETIVDPELLGVAFTAATGATGGGVGAGVATTGAGVGVGAGVGTGIGEAATGAAPTAAPSLIIANSAPTGTVESIATTIFCRTPATGDGISVSTLSVETSNSGSSTATTSPSFFSHLVTVPSVTDSPRAGMVTENVIT
jgi:hypothetical protein